MVSGADPCWGWVRVQIVTGQRRRCHKGQAGGKESWPVYWHMKGICLVHTYGECGPGTSRCVETAALVLKGVHVDRIVIAENKQILSPVSIEIFVCK